MKRKNGFTLVELLAVIVILAIILVIAVPQIMDTIDSARKSSLLSSARMIASAAETQYSVNQTLGDSTAITCSSVVPNLNASDYDLTTTGMCTITISSGTATVNLSGKAGGKFANYKVCGATSSNDVTVANVTSEATRKCS